MSSNEPVPHADAQVDNEGDIDEDLWDSPNKTDGRLNAASNRPVPYAKPTYQDQQTREHALRQELAQVRRVNEAIEGVLQSLGKAKSNMEAVNQTVDSASTLLNTWTRILSQTEHHQRLILDPQWHGAQQDIANMQNDVLAQQQARERREAEEQERRAAVAKRSEDEERRRAEAELKSTKPPGRGRGRAHARGSRIAQSSSTGYVATGGPGNTSISSISRVSATRRPTSGMGRGANSREARGRGVS